MLVNKTFTHVQEQKKRCRRDIPLTFRLVQNRLSMSNISSCVFFIVIAGNFFDPVQVWNKYFPVN